MWGVAGAHGHVDGGRSLEARSRAKRLVAWSVIYLGAHLLAAEWAFALNDDHSVLIWYPPAGLAIAALILVGPRLLPAVVVGEILSTWITSGHGGTFGLGWMVVNGLALALGWWVAAALFSWLGGLAGLRRLRDIVALAAAVTAGPVIAAGLGTLVQVQVGLIDYGDYWSEVGVFWVGDVVGVAALLPALLVGAMALWSGDPGALSDRYSHGRSPPPGVLPLQAVVPSVLALLLLWFVDTPMRLVYLAAVPAVVLAVRHGVRMAAASSLALCSLVAAAAATLEVGTAERTDLQLMAVVVTILGLVAGASESQRRDLLERRAELASIVETSPDLIATATRDGEMLYCNPAGRRMLGVPEGEELSVWDFLDGSSARAQLREAVRAAFEDKVWSGENTIVSRTGQRIEVAQVVVGHRDPDGVVRRLSTHCHDITDHRRLETQLANRALYDELTGLANRALLLEHLDRVARSDPDRGAVLCLVDLVRFRDINESLGYGVGDEVLSTVARRISSAATTRQLVARLSADTFAVVDEQVEDEYDALSLATSLAERISAPIRVLGNAMVVECSVGAVLIGDRQDALDSLRQAEIALSRAKESHGHFALFNAEMDRRARDRVLVENDLREAIANDEWALDYQPVVDLQSRLTVCCEALLRWSHPERGAMPAGAVIAMAESTGLIVPLGARVLEEACRMACAWHAAGHDVSVAINVSGRQLAEPDFAAEVASILDSAGVVPERVILEVTESALVAAVPGAITTLARLRSLGCEVAIDDFGTGYASFSTLRDLPIDELKLDRSFLTDLTTSKRTCATVEALIAMANALGMVVVAEGVEEVEQLELLRSMGCHRAQGYLLARPMPPERISSTLGQPLGG